MKKSIVFVVALLAAASIFAQTEAAAPAAVETVKAESSRYVVYSELGQTKADDLAANLDALFDLFNSVFRFDPANLPGKLTVREFAGKEAFDSYLTQTLGQTKEDFVYLHYSGAERRELLIFAKDGAEREASLDHQAFIQYIKAFVQNPPLWLRDGFAVYFESARWDPEAKRLSFAENLDWLETIKSVAAKNELIPLSRLLQLTPEESRSSLDVYYPEAWAFVSFLDASDTRDFNRLLWDSISGLRREASLVENQAFVKSRVDVFYGAEALDKAFGAYLEKRLTFPELVAEGVRAYGAKEFDTSRASFEAARSLNPGSYVPPYYLGLIAYAVNDYGLADYEYQNALSLGCDPAIANYALGLSAYAATRGEDAKRYLLEAKSAAPERYTEKVDDLLKKLNK